MKKFFLCLVLTVLCVPAHAQVPDFKEYFEVDLDAPLPNMEELKEEYIRASEVYNPRYIVSWELGGAFDEVWRAVISYYGTSEKRLRASGEEELTAWYTALYKGWEQRFGRVQALGRIKKLMEWPGNGDIRCRRLLRRSGDIEGCIRAVLGKHE